MLIDQPKFEDILHSHNLAITSTRKKIYQSLANYDKPISTNALISSLSGQVDRSCVYRNIEVFEKINIINKVYTGWKYRIELSERFRPHHHHLTCKNCGKIIPISLGERMEKAIENFGAEHNFKITSHEVELRGLCRDCC